MIPTETVKRAILAIILNIGIMNHISRRMIAFYNKMVKLSQYRTHLWYMAITVDSGIEHG